MLDIFSSISDIKIFRMKHMDDKMWWFYHHISAMCGAFIATVTAFLVNAVGPLVADMAMGWLIWILPAIIGAPGVSFWTRYYKRKFNGNRNGKLNEDKKRMPVPSES